MKKLSLFITTTLLLSAGMQARQNHIPNMVITDSAIAATRTALTKLEQFRDYLEIMAKHNAVAKKMTGTAAFQSFNNGARDAVTQYHRDATQHFAHSSAQIATIEKHATNLATLSDKALTDSSLGVQKVQDANITAKATLNDLKSETQSAADLADTSNG